MKMNKYLQRYFFSSQHKNLNSLYIPNKPDPIQFTPRSNAPKTLSPKHQKKEPWTKDEVVESTEKHVVFTWGATDPMRKAAKDFARGEGIYLYDYSGKKYIDWTSQAVSNNLGYTIPDQIHDAISKQLKTLHNLYGGLTISEPKAKLAQIMNDITPSNITGFIFPCTGSDANEVAIRAARRFTGRNKILTRYKSYHGGGTGTLTATGDFRRQFAENGVSGFVKFFDFQAMQFTWGKTEAESIQNYLAYLEEVIISEQPHTVAAIMVETITGSGGTLVNPDGVIKGIRALCDKYKILLILDEVMVGIGRTGEFFSFQTYDGVVPDIFTCAKGISGSFLPLSGVGFSKEIQDFFRTNALGWGTTFQAHPVSCICGYEVIKYMIENKTIQHIQKMEKVMSKRMEELVNKHNCLRQGRIRGLFGAFDIVGKDGQLIKKFFTDPEPEVIHKFKQKLLDNGIYMWLRAPIFHCAPPLIITETELNDAFDRIDDALYVLDH